MREMQALREVGEVEIDLSQIDDGRMLTPGFILGLGRARPFAFHYDSTTARFCFRITHKRSPLLLHSLIEMLY